MILLELFVVTEHIVIIYQLVQTCSSLLPLLILVKEKNVFGEYELMLCQYTEPSIIARTCDKKKITLKVITNCISHIEKRIWGEEPQIQRDVKHNTSIMVLNIIQAEKPMTMSLNVSFSTQVYLSKSCLFFPQSTQQIFFFLFYMFIAFVELYYSTALFRVTFNQQSQPSPLRSCLDHLGFSTPTPQQGTQCYFSYSNILAPRKFQLNQSRSLNHIEMKDLE